MSLKIEAFFIAVYLFFAGFIYGDEPVKLEFSYDIPSEVYVYEPGDTVEINVTVKNVGRPFEETRRFWNTRNICIYNSDDIKLTDIYRQDEYYTDDVDLWLFKRNESKNYKIVFVIPDNVMSGSYDMTVTYKETEHTQTFKDIFQIK